MNRGDLVFQRRPRKQLPKNIGKTLKETVMPSLLRQILFEKNFIKSKKKSRKFKKIQKKVKNKPKKIPKNPKKIQKNPKRIQQIQANFCFVHPNHEWLTPRYISSAATC